MNTVIPEGYKSVIPVLKDSTDKDSTRIILVDEVLHDNKMIQLLRVDCENAKFYRVRFLAYPGAQGNTLPFSTFKEAKRIFELSKTILLS